jgi:hypothetical protein
MKNIIAILSLLSMLSTATYACDFEQAVEIVKADLNRLAKSGGTTSVAISVATNTDVKRPDFFTFLFRLESKSETGGPLGMIGFDLKKCEVTGTLILPIVAKFETK